MGRFEVGASAWLQYPGKFRQEETQIFEMFDEMHATDSVQRIAFPRERVFVEVSLVVLTAGWVVFVVACDVSREILEIGAHFVKVAERFTIGRSHIQESSF